MTGCDLAIVPCRQAPRVGDRQAVGGVFLAGNCDGTEFESCSSGGLGGYAGRRTSCTRRPFTGELTSQLLWPFAHVFLGGPTGICPTCPAVLLGGFAGYGICASIVPERSLMVPRPTLHTGMTVRVLESVPARMIKFMLGSSRRVCIQPPRPLVSARLDAGRIAWRPPPSVPTRRPIDPSASRTGSARRCMNGSEGTARPTW